MILHFFARDKSHLKAYLSYCILFVIIHLIFISIFTFFHFLLDHEIATVENWLNRNGWQIIIFSKLISFVLCIKVMNFISYKKIEVTKFFRGRSLRPSIKIYALTFFLLVTFYALTSQFGLEISPNRSDLGVASISYFGAISFFLIDFIYLHVTNPDKGKYAFSHFHFLATLIFFFVSSNIALPYLRSFSLFLILHFYTLYLFSRKEKLGDIIFYLLFVVGPISSIFGVDFVWNDSLSFFKNSFAFPLIGLILLWSVSLYYYSNSRLD